MLSTRELEIALFQAIEAQDGNAVAHLIAAGANPNAKLGGFQSAMKHASTSPDFGVIQALIKGGASISGPDSDLGSVVFYLDHGGELHPRAADIFGLFVDHGADPWARGGFGRQSPMMNATDRLRLVLQAVIDDREAKKRQSKKSPMNIY